ncbi:MAG: hypothetical protein KDA92_03480, partial [Planctomycetales bacterium]|nr:hypothetical protein [Planctomycetales bacterium]
MNYLKRQGAQVKLLRYLITCLGIPMICSAATGQLLPVVRQWDFEGDSDFDPTQWLFVAPTPLGVNQAVASHVISTGEGRWIWSIESPNEVLVGVNHSIELTDSLVETQFDFVGSGGGISMGFLNRFGTVPNPIDPDVNAPLAHGYCTLVSPQTITLIDFDFARDPSDYVR